MSANPTSSPWSSPCGKGSPEFDEWWGLHEVVSSGVGRKLVDHPQAGRLRFEHAAFRLEDNLDRRLILYTPAGEKTRQKLDELLAEQPPGRS